MHPTIQQSCKTKTYSRRSEVQQMEHQQHEYNKSTDRHRQTLIGEEQTKQTDNQEADKLGPEEDVCRMRDCTARQKHDEQHKRHNGILYKQEKEDGTRATSTNLSGSQFDFEFMLEHCKDHVMLIQEHWRLKEELHTLQTLAYLKGWQGIWEPAE
eukprot:14469926-Heterocapsa_arctica.AAC.1